MSLLVKICGLSDEASVRAARAAGADMIGLVFFARSPRNVSVSDAVGLARIAREDPALTVVALTVDPSDEAIAEIMEAVAPDMLQLHGSETPERVREIAGRFNVATMKAIGVREPSDLVAIDAYCQAADRILLDAKPPKDAVLPGGNGIAFDWHMLQELDLDDRFMLSGGLDPETVGTAISTTGIAGVDVSSGVESAPGRKQPALIAEFVTAARRQEREGTEV
ncbi:MAG: phosphoribosylanthranilate isomerase [Pseudomonadota bacterium]